MVAEQKEWLRGLYERLASDAGAPELTDALFVLHEGALVATTAGGVADATRSARQAAAALLSP